MEKKVYVYKNEVNDEFINNIGWSSGYNDCEMNIDESIY